MVDTARITHTGSYVELDPENRVHITHAGSYVELDPENRVHITHAGSYVELDIRDDVKITHVGVYIEHDVAPPADNTIRYTHAGAYLEYEFPTVVARVTAVTVLAETSQKPHVAVDQMFLYVETLDNAVYVSKVMGLVEMEAIPTNMAVYRQQTSGGRAYHAMLPEEVTGYALDPEYSFWTIVVQEETENLVKSPSFELDNISDEYLLGPTGTFTLESGFPYAIAGGKFLKIVRDALMSEDYIETKPILLDGGTYTFSIYLWGWIGQRFKLSVIDDTDTEIAYRWFDIENAGWQRYALTYKEIGLGDRKFRLTLSGLGVPPDRYLATDAWQVEEKPYATDYVDGDMFSPSDRPGRKSMVWTGEAHHSSSIRYVWAEGYGRRINLSDEFQFYTTSIVGLGMSERENQLSQTDIGTMLYAGSIDKPKQFSIIGRLFAKNYKQLQESRSRFINLLRGNVAGRRPRHKIYYQPTNSAGTPYGVALGILASYEKGLEGRINNHYSETIPVQFQASWNSLEEDLAQARKLNPAAFKGYPAVWFQYHDIAQDTIVTGTGSGPTKNLYGCKYGPQEEIIFFGTYTNLSIGSLGPFNYVAYWDPYEVDWGSEYFKQIPYGTSGPNGAVRNVYIGHNSGRIYIMGDFDDVGGDTSMRGVFYIADMSAAASSVWKAFTNPLPTSAIVRTVLELPIGSTGISDPDCIIGGSFTFVNPNTGDTINNVIMNNNLDPLAAFEGLNGTVHDIVMSPDRYIYFVGEFTQTGTGGHTENGVCRIKYLDLIYSVYPPEDVGPSTGTFKGHSADIGPDGNLYVGGILNKSGTDYRVVMMFDGTNWTTIAESLNEDPSPVNALVKIKFDSFGVLHVINVNQTIGGRVTHAFDVYNRTIRPADFMNIDEINGASTSIAGFDFNEFGDIALAGELINANIGTISMNDGYYGVSDNRIEYDGSANCYPTIIITGNGTVEYIQNKTTGGSIYFVQRENDKFRVYDGERVIISLENGTVRAWSNQRGDITHHIALGISNIKNMFLIPGENKIFLLGYSVYDDPSFGVYLSWKNRYHSIDEAISR
ncbi:MAG: hypothetical protein KatS3mg087_1815 [Patescibacteria group bacterium]|nr:MAG: hypothetical protein KatS3mg087_1815 [Patescibacteria group bacterium]